MSLKKRTFAGIRVFAPLVTDGPFSDEPDPVPTPSVEELAAILEPCRNLVELSLPDQGITGCGRTVATYHLWVERAFNGHRPLQKLSIPSTNGFTPGALCQLLSRCVPLRDITLVDIPVGSVDRLLAPLVGPWLRRVSLSVTGVGPTAETMRLLDRCPLLESLSINICPPSLLLDRLSQLTELRLFPNQGDRDYRVPPHNPNLTTLALDACSPETALELATASFGRLSELTLQHLPEPADLRALLTENAATLAKVHLGFGENDVIADLATFECLGRLERLTDLELCAYSPTAIPQPLMDRLSRLVFRAPLVCPEDHIRICGSDLRSLSLYITTYVSLFDLQCPLLEELRLPPGNPASSVVVRLRCPHLRGLSDLVSHAQVEHPGGPLAHLEVLQFGQACPAPKPALSLLFEGHFPALRILRNVRTDVFDILERLCGCAATPRLSTLSIEYGGEPPCFGMLQVGPTLRSLDLSMRRDPQCDDLEAAVANPDAELALEGPGLRTLHLNAPECTRLTLCMPQLAILWLDSLVSLKEPIQWSSAPPGRLRSLTMLNCPHLDQAAMAARFSETLRQPTLSRMPVCRWAPPPGVRDLRLVQLADSCLVIDCAPGLQVLAFTGCRHLTEVALTGCVGLEELTAVPGARISQLRLPEEGLMPMLRVVDGFPWGAIGWWKDPG
ncbi:hypothetical protein PAPYR_7635 [Paratrimastix pyriformis]|uniref:Uncharacterized protein n=1 Tax=Paratrimastix pyriformis TaxID=342808 RepID=A0ABQ8UI58_9EUKA|nr:hypothetical protein PAPYR_7635 [Paratrimastix pyriformis]